MQPQQWPMQPPTPKKPWYSGVWGITALVSSGVLLLVCACCSGLLILSSHLPTTSTTSAIPTVTTQSQTTQPVVLISPTATTRPTATTKPQPQPVSGPYVGGTQGDFTTQYGSPDVSFGVANYDVTISNTPVHIALSDQGAGSDGQQRVTILMVADPDGEAWDAATSQQVIHQFLPPDARHVRHDQKSDVGTLNVYQSTSLALSFPASAFTNSGGGGLEPPGTLSYTCDAPGTIGCTLSIGE